MVGRKTDFLGATRYVHPFADTIKGVFDLGSSLGNSSAFVNVHATCVDGALLP
jgi:hypothetical protein